MFCSLFFCFYFCLCFCYSEYFRGRVDTRTCPMQVFKEAHRVLKKGGRLCISDVVALKDKFNLPVSDSKDEEQAYCACVTGAVPVTTLEELLNQAGFQQIRSIPFCRRVFFVSVGYSWFVSRAELCVDVSVVSKSARRARNSSRIGTPAPKRKLHQPQSRQQSSSVVGSCRQPWVCDQCNTFFS